MLFLLMRFLCMLDDTSGLGNIYISYERIEHVVNLMLLAYK
jgi:hypothetical protein